MRPQFIHTFFIAVILLSLACSREGNRPNIVLIIAEDISTDLGCYGRQDLQTPALDNLASEGVLFENAFTTSPVCSPSRSAIMTGMYQNSIGAHNHRSNAGPLKGEVRPFTHFLRDAGYYTCNVVAEEYGTGKTDFNFEDGFLFEGNDWDQRANDQPFFAQISIYTTHRDTHWYGIEDRVGRPVNPEKVSLPAYYPDHPVSRLDWARYLNSIQYMDQQVEAILTRLKREGLMHNTAIIFMADHGRCHIRGKQWLYDSGIRIPLIMWWPGMPEGGKTIRDLISAIDVPATILDLAGIPLPGYLQGQSLVAGDYRPREEVFAARDRCDAVVDRIRAVRTGRYKYIRNDMPDRPYNQFGHYKSFYYPMLHLMEVLDARNELEPRQAAFMEPKKPGEELYDIQNDPEELINLAGVFEYQGVLEDLRAKLREWEQYSGDLDNPAEDEVFMKDLLKRREEKYRPLWEERGIDPHDPPEVHLDWWYTNLEVQKFLDNQPLEKKGAVRKVYKVTGRDTLYAYLHYPPGDSLSGPFPAIVFFHGGGWKRGKSEQFDRQSRYLATRGMVAVQADYRVMLRDSVTPFECVTDGKSAIRWVRQNATELNIDPHRIAAGGGSAGGHIAAACGHIDGLDCRDENLAISSKPDALVLFNPVFDNGPGGYRHDLFGDSYRHISPAHNIARGDPPALVMLGDKDQNLPVAVAQRYKKRMDSVGIDCDVVVYPDQGHGFFNPGKGGEEIYVQTIEDMDRFLVRHGFLNETGTHGR